MNLALFDIQHVGRPSRPGDLGAACDLDGDGVVEPDEREVALVRQYVAEARTRLEAAGVRVVVLEHGEYRERHAQAGEEARGARRAAYVACHVNAGGGDYGLVVFDGRSVLGRALADRLCEALVMRCRPPLTRAVTSWTASASDASPYPRAWSCIQGIYRGPAGLSGCLYEPFFLDRPDHAALATEDGLRRVGAALAAGVLAHLEAP